MPVDGELDYKTGLPEIEEITTVAMPTNKIYEPFVIDYKSVVIHRNKFIISILKRMLKDIEKTYGKNLLKTKRSVISRYIRGLYRENEKYRRRKLKDA